MERLIERQLSFAKLSIQIESIGKDYHIIVRGGEKPHIGSVVLAVPRPSLKGDGMLSCTSSVMNMVGHKDEKICRALAEQMAIKKNAVVVCAGGFHVDGITKEQISEVMYAVNQMIEVCGEM